MDVFALTMRLKEEGAATVEAAMTKMRRSMNSAETEAKQLDGAFGKLKGAMQGLVAGLSVGLVMEKIATETSAAQFAAAQLNAALKSTGGAAGQSADALMEHAAALQKVTVFGDDAIVTAQAMLLTFTRIQGDVFPKATEAVLNVAQAMGTDLKSAAIQVGKALNDPVLGVSALARSGIQFTDAQKQMIGQLVESNKLLDAQTIILKELETQFGGSARAARDTLGGALKGLQNSFGDLFEMSGEGSAGLVNAINSISDSLAIFAGVLNDVVQFLSVAFVGTVKAVNNILLILRQMLVKAADDFMSMFEILRYIPGVGSAVGKGLDAVRGSLARSMATLKADQASWVAWEQQQYKNIFVAKKVEQQMRNTAAATNAAAAAAGGGGKPGTKPPTPAEVAKRIGGTTFGGTPFKPGFDVAMIDPAVLVREKIAQLKPMLSEAQTMFLAEMEQLAANLDRQLTVVFADAFATGIENAIKSGSLRDGLRSLLAAMLSGIGSILIQLGTALLPVGKLIAKLWRALSSLNPVAMTAAAIGLIAVGAAMKGIAGRVVGGATGGGGGMVASAASGGMGGASGSMTLPGLTYAPTAAGSAATIQQVPATNITIIGPNDPSAQRQMQELMRNAQRRGEA